MENERGLWGEGSVGEEMWGGGCGEDGVGRTVQSLGTAGPSPPNRTAQHHSEGFGCILHSV